MQGGYSNVINEKWAIEGYLKYNYVWTKYREIDDKYIGGKIEDEYKQQEYYASAGVKFTPSKVFTFTFAQDIFDNTLVSTTPYQANPKRFNSLSALAAQYMSERLTVTASLLGIYNCEQVDFGEPSPNRKHLSPSFGVSYKILSGKNLRVRLSVKDSYRIPNFNDLYYPRIGTRLLKPEKAIQYNAGITFNDKLFLQLLDFVSLSADGYYNRVTDKIVAMPTMFIWKMLNMGKVDVWGADFNFATGITVSKSIAINLSGNYSYQYAIDLTDNSAKNYKHQIPYTPEHSGNISLTCTNKWVNLGYTFSVVGERYALPQNIEENRINGYCDQNISLSKSFDIKRCKLSLQAEVLNVGDATYDVIQYYPMPGRQFRFTLKFKY